MKNILFILAIVCMAFPAHALRTSSTIDAFDDLVAIATVNRDRVTGGRYEGGIVSPGETAPAAGNNYGGGGGGAATATTSGVAGAAGAAGVIYVLEF